MLSTVNWTKKNSGLGKSLIPVNGHNSKLSSYPIDWSSLEKFPFTVDSDRYRDPQRINKQNKRQWWRLSCEWDFYITSFLQSTGIIMAEKAEWFQEPQVVDIYSEAVPSGHDRICIHSSQKYMSKTCTKPSQLKSNHVLGRGSWNPTSWLRSYWPLMAAGERVFSIVKALRDCPPHAAVDSLTLCTRGRHEVDSVDSAATTKSKLKEGVGMGEELEERDRFD